jgi:hypothetical protein
MTGRMRDGLLEDSSNLRIKFVDSTVEKWS